MFGLAQTLWTGVINRRHLGDSVLAPGEDAFYYFYITAADLPGYVAVGYSSVEGGVLFGESLSGFTLSNCFTGEANLLIQFSGDLLDGIGELQARINGILVENSSFSFNGESTFTDNPKPFDFQIGETYLIELV